MLLDFGKCVCQLDLQITLSSLCRTRNTMFFFNILLSKVKGISSKPKSMISTSNMNFVNGRERLGLKGFLQLFPYNNIKKPQG